MTEPPGSGLRGRGPGEPDLSGTILAFDFGERRIGVAVGETATRIANPLTTIDARDNEARFAAVERLVREWRPAGFVIGLPRHADGTEHPIARLASKFARRLQGRHGLPVRFIDETLSSASAAQSIREAGGHSRKADLDAVSAAIILQSYLDAARETGA